jgi:hypothetical protein
MLCVQEELVGSDALRTRRTCWLQEELVILMICVMLYDADDMVRPSYLVAAVVYDADDMVRPSCVVVLYDADDMVRPSYLVKMLVISM